MIRNTYAERSRYLDRQFLSTLINRLKWIVQSRLTPSLRASLHQVLIARRSCEFAGTSVSCRERPRFLPRQDFPDPYRDPIPIERYTLRCHRLGCHGRLLRPANREAGSRNPPVDPEID